MNITKKLYSTALIFTFFLFLVSFSFANDWDLDGIDLISRGDRGADESWRYQSHDVFQNILVAEDTKVDLDTLRDTDFEAYLRVKQKQYEREKANSYLMENYGDDFEIDSSVAYHEGNELRTKEYIHNKKIELIVHHTADKYSEYINTDEIKAYIQRTYKYHSLTKAWWDIGYNFLIDQWGNIYEWRAGGKWAVGMHTMYNNTPSIGIGMIGNFNEEKPTGAQVKSLIKLLTALAKEYEINPEDSVMYHKKIKNDPYLQSSPNYTIAGHRDAGYTSCPGENLYKMLPDIREVVKNNLNKIQLLVWVKKKIILPSIYYSNQNIANLTVDLWISSVSSCYSSDPKLNIDSCKFHDDAVYLTFSKWIGFSSGRKQIVIKDTRWIEKTIELLILRESDLTPLTRKIKEDYMQKHNIKTASTTMQKIWHKITPQEARQFMNENIRVLLWQLSQNYVQRTLECKNECTFLLDGNLYLWKTWTILNKWNELVLQINSNEITGKEIYVTSDDEIIQVTNYNRVSYVGIPWNEFEWSLHFKKDKIWNKKTEWFEWKYVIVNSLRFDDYLAGIVETNDSESYEKNKVMAMIAKSYALFYQHPDNRHPNVPENASYNAIDDPDLFQKYVWVWLKKTLTKRYMALEDTKDQLAVYDGYVPILPYFHCSVGFSYTAQEKRGWTDTPYLKSRIDLSRCSEFEWHGVWLSGKWSEWWIRMWMDYLQILDYYYEGVSVVNF